MEKSNISYVAAKFPYTTLMTWEFYKHKHSFWEFVICISGTGYHFINEQKYTLTPGDILIIKPDSTHDYKLPDKDNYAHYDYYASLQDMRKACEDINPNSYKPLLESKTPILINAGNAKILLEGYLLKLNSIQTNKQFESLSLTIYNTVLRLICGMILENLEQQNSNMPDWLSNILSLMSRPENLTGDLKGVIEKTNFSHGHLCRIFKKHMGQTLSEYFTKMKIDYSTVLLKNKNMNILDISLSLGYNSVSHFITLFNKYYGTTPKQYQKTLNI